MYNNRRFPKVFVFNPATELITTSAKKPTDLTAGQVGFFNPLTGNGFDTGALTPSRANLPVLRISQNLGDNNFGLTNAKTIALDRVTAFRAVKAVAPQTQRTFIGWNGTTGSLAATVGQSLVIPITIYDNELTKWYGGSNTTPRIVPNPSVYAGLAEGDPIDQSKLADDIVAQINGTDAPAGAYPTTGDLKRFVVATKINSGANYGVQIDSIAPAIQSLNLNDPKDFYKPNVRQFTVGTDPYGPGWLITTTQVAKPGTGWPKQVADMEKESQGYGRVRDQFEYAQNMKTNFIIRAVDGTKYDFYYIEYNWAHTNTATPSRTEDPYAVVLICPTGTGGPIETFFNAWLSGNGFPAVNVSSGSAQGTAAVQMAQA